MSTFVLEGKTEVADLWPNTSRHTEGAGTDLHLRIAKESDTLSNE